MDALDVAILRELRLEPFQGKPRSPAPWRPAVLARRVHASQRLVKDRLRRLHSKVIAGYDVWPNPAALGTRQVTFGFQFSRQADMLRCLGSVRQMEGFLGNAQFVPPWLNATFAARDGPDFESLRHSIQVAAGQAPAAEFDVPAWPLKRAPSELDWRILEAFRGDARRSFRDVAAALRTTPRTIERRLEAMARDGIFDTFVRLRDSALDDLLLFALVLRFEPAKAEGAIRGLHEQTLADAWVRCDSSAPESGRHVDVVLAPGTPAKIKSLIATIEGLPGVQQVEMFLGATLELESPSLDRQMAGAAKGTKAR